MSARFPLPRRTDANDAPSRDAFAHQSSRRLGMPKLSPGFVDRAAMRAPRQAYLQCRLKCSLRSRESFCEQLYSLPVIIAAGFAINCRHFG
jgi:hypothetical protein